MIFLKSTKLHLFLIISVTALAYLNIFQNDFVIDDKTFILNWEKGRSISNFIEFFKGEAPKGHEGVYRPIRSVIYALYYQAFRANPFYYHLHSILVHLASTSLVYLILRFFVRLWRTQNDIGWVAFFGALLFGLHPIHTETISYVSASVETFGTLFFFASFYLYLKGSAISKSLRMVAWQRPGLLRSGSLFFAFLAFLHMK